MQRVTTTAEYPSVSKQKANRANINPCWTPTNKIKYTTLYNGYFLETSSVTYEGCLCKS
jgi:hypothetical protein